MSLTNLMFFLAGVVLSCWIVWLIRFLRSSEESLQRGEANRILAANRMASFTYMASLGVEDPELRNALAKLEGTGKIVLDERGSVVGGLLPKVVEGPNFQLVVNNMD